MFNRMFSRSSRLCSFARPALVAAAFIMVCGLSSNTVRGEEDPEDPFAGEWTIFAEPDQDAIDAGQTPFTEAALFHNGEFSAAVFAMFGFSPAPYTVSYDTGSALFVAVLPSNDRGSLTWVGAESPTGFSGELLWTRADGQELRYMLTGERAGN
jgi:hypothetical protein